ncbi:TraR/DksA C4-type zinc finger protein [Verrucomicrobiaceae bacterium N1E253]|uniref:TraR/DksA C4-type zinc finger protein n=1 Tax=Oceaniferula marina TaxID=2748318 RepID=A0A851GEP5_9BACT|nr:TraR/DksA C4-type zinc finger protein [Oceaniferula marina]NWK56013.1 TraR/DksA C4-type zinc finger protein [Oceaniferula marina]
MAAKKKTTEKTTSPAKKAAKKTVKKAAAKKTAKKTVAKKAAAKKTEAKPAEPVKPVELKGFAKKQHQRLLDLRDGLLDAMYGVTHDTLKNTDGMETGAGGQHTGDAGSDSYDRDFALNLLAKEQDALNEIEQAIDRCNRGVYGVCEMSGEKIPKERLEAIPFARFTVQCQMKWEQENNQSAQSTRSDFTFSSGAMR